MAWRPLRQHRRMDELTPLERAVMDVIGRQQPANAVALGMQLTGTRVVSRENTGAGFFTTFAVTSGVPIEGMKVPLGDVGATVHGLTNGMGFLLWLKDGWLHQLEGYSYEEDTSDLDFDRVEFGGVAPRM